MAQSSVETINRKEFGACEVYDRVDMFSDETTHVLRCEEPRSSTFGNTAIIDFIVWDNGGFVVAVSNGVQEFHTEDTILVTVRVDRGTVITGDWRFTNNMWGSRAFDVDVFTTLLTEIANGDRIAIRVNHRVATIPLTSIGEAGSGGVVEEFLARIGHISLEVH